MGEVGILTRLRRGMRLRKKVNKAESTSIITKTLPKRSEGNRIDDIDLIVEICRWKKWQSLRKALADCSGDLSRRRLRHPSLSSSTG